MDAARMSRFTRECRHEHVSTGEQQSGQCLWHSSEPVGWESQAIGHKWESHHWSFPLAFGTLGDLIQSSLVDALGIRTMC